MYKHKKMYNIKDEMIPIKILYPTQGNKYSM